MNPQNIHTPSPDVEPPTQSVATRQDMPPHTAIDNALIGPPLISTRRKSRRPVVATLILVAVLLLGFGAFYSFYRTPNGEYDSVVKDLRVMRSAAQVIPFGEDVLDKSYDFAKDEPKKNAARDYIASLDRLKKSPILERDSEVRGVYEKGSLIDAYGQSSLDMLETIYVFLKVDQTCRDAFNSAQKAIAISTFKNNILYCAELLDENPHVPLEDFDKATYKKIVSIEKEIAERLLLYIAAYQRSDSAEVAIQNTKISELYAAYTKATTNVSTLHNTHNPTEQIDALIRVVEERKKVLFRH